MVFGYALHHLTDMQRWKLGGSRGCSRIGAEAMKMIPTILRSSTQSGPNFMTKTIEIDWVAMAATVRQMESSPRKKEWIMAVYEIMERNLLNDTEYLIGLPTCDISARKVFSDKASRKTTGIVAQSV